MCVGCWVEAGKPWIVNEKTLRAVETIKRLYDVDGVGGRMHIVTDDFNIDDENIAFCDDYIARAERGDIGAWDARDAATIAIERACCDAFKAMTFEERASALAMEGGYDKVPL